jgi:antitoxin CptB
MLELDRMLEGFLVAGYESLSPVEKQRFAEILEFPDPDLHAYFLGKAEPEDAALARLVRTIREDSAVQA